MGTFFNDKIEQFATDEDEKQLMFVMKEPTEENARKYFSIKSDVVRRYLESCNNDPNIVLQDMIEFINQTTKDKFDLFIDIQEQAQKTLLSKNKTDIETMTIINQTKKLLIRNYYTFHTFVSDGLEDFRTAIIMWEYEPHPDKIAFDILKDQENPCEIKDWKPINDILDDNIYKKYCELYPEATDEPQDTQEIIQAHQARIHYRAISEVEYPLDKPNRELWRAIEEAEQGQLSFVFETGRSNSEATVICSVDWEDPNTQITKNLTEWDKRVYVSAASLFSGGNDTVTLSQIYKIMGNDGSPNKTQTKKINESLTKMGTARLRINNHGEIEAGYNYPAFEYDAPLLPFERMTATINGKEVTAIHILKEPPLISFARGRKQITTIALELLKSPISKTDDNLRIDDFLLDYISHIKRDKKLSNKLTFDTLCKACNAKTKMQKNRLPEKVEKYLAHYVKCNWIKSYSITEDKDIIIEVEK